MSRRPRPAAVRSISGKWIPLPFAVESLRLRAAALLAVEKLERGEVEEAVRALRLALEGAS